MLYLERAYGNTNMTALVGLVAIQVSDDVLLAVGNRHLLAFCQTDALVALRRQSIRTISIASCNALQI